jgi:hypothetical protein
LIQCYPPVLVSSASSLYLRVTSAHFLEIDLHPPPDYGNMSINGHKSGWAIPSMVSIFTNIKQDRHFLTNWTVTSSSSTVAILRCYSGIEISTWQQMGRNLETARRTDLHLAYLSGMRTGPSWLS